MITTVTLNPAIDKMITVEKMNIGGVNIVGSIQIDPGGKGVNVSRVIQRLRGKTVALGFVGGGMGRCIIHCLKRERVTTDFVEVEGETRVNLSLMERSKKTVTSFHEMGHRVREIELEILKDKLKGWLAESKIVVLSGSVPPGIHQGIYKELIFLIKSRGVKVFLDTHGQPLKEGIKAAPYLVKPNLDEMRELTGSPLSSDEDIVSSGKRLIESGVDIGIVSMGERGAYIFTEDKTLRAVAPRIEMLSTIGSGDSMIAGLALSLARGDSLEDAISLGVAAGAATAMTMGTELCRRDDVVRLKKEIKIMEVH